MKNTLVILVVLAVAVLFYWQFFVPAPSPADQIEFSSDGFEATSFDEQAVEAQF